MRQLRFLLFGYELEVIDGDEIAPGAFHLHLRLQVLLLCSGKCWLVDQREQEMGLRLSSISSTPLALFSSLQ